jgi:hypothetical protein
MNLIKNLLQTLTLSLVPVLALHAQQAQPPASNLTGHWKLTTDTKDASKNNRQSIPHGDLKFSDGHASFDGTSSWLEIPQPGTNPGKEDFSISTWLYTDPSSGDIPGDIISQYDSKQRKGFHLSLKSNASPTSQANYQQLCFGIDDNHASPWVDYGKPGNALLAFSMADYQGELYAGICQAGDDETGKVFKRGTKGEWVDCGAPDQSNTVMALAVFEGQLYAATGHYRIQGSSLPASNNKVFGGKVFRYLGSNRWVDCGQLPGVEAVGGMVIYKGKLYASSMYSPGLFRYEGGSKWVSCDIPDKKRVVNMAVYNGYLYASSWDVANVYRYDGSKWEDCGLVGNNTQTYGFTVYQGNLFVSTWPSGRVFRFDGIKKWADVGRLGNELEVMGLITHNGQMLGGTLPLAEVYVYEGDTLWTRMDQLDKTPDVRYRRAWAMAESDGKVFCSTLPSGKILGYEAGKSVTMGESLEAGWQHVTAVKTSKQLRLYVNGKLVATKAIPKDMTFDLTTEAPLKIGFGCNDYFNGKLRDLRLYHKALTVKEIATLAKNRE